MDKERSRIEDVIRSLKFDFLVYDQVFDFGDESSHSVDASVATVVN